MADPRLIELPSDEQSDAAQVPDSAFYLDPADPECWLASERVIKTLGSPAAWTPIRLSTAGGDAPSAGRDGLHPVARADCPADGHPHQLSEDDIKQAVEIRGLLPFKPPAKWLEGEGFDSTNCLLATTFAKQAGKTVAFSLALSRQIWCAGRDPEDLTTVMLAGAAAEIHPNAIEKALGLKSLRAELDRASAEAASFGVTSLPTVRIGDAIFVGDAGLDEAAAKIHG